MFNRGQVGGRGFDPGESIHRLGSLALRNGFSYLSLCRDLLIGFGEDLLDDVVRAFAHLFPLGHLGRGSGAFLGAQLDPLRIGHRRARREHAHPGTVRRLGEEDGDFELACEHAEAGNVVLVLVGDEDGVQRGGVFPGNSHTLE